MPHYRTQDGAEIHYEIFENCLPKTTLFLHGNLASNHWWYPLQQELKNHNPNGKGSMILAEFRGCGKSSAPKSQSEINMHTFAADLSGLAQNISNEPINLVGHSTGGLIAALMLAQSPALFSSAILLDPVGARGVKFESSMDEAFAAMKTDLNLTSVVIGSTIHNNNAEDAWFKTKIVPDAFHAIKTVGAGVLKALDGLDVTAEMKTIKQSVLVLHGEHDQLLPIADSKELAQLIPHAKFEVVAGQGHCTNLENPKLMANIIQRFLFL
jgi:pimeloyl-ACP methyl ester carboxylesterase